MNWEQAYQPLQNGWLSFIVALLPMAVLLGCLGIIRMKAHWAAMLGLACILLVSTLVYGMPVGMAAASALNGAAYGLLPIGWIILNVIFLFNLTKQKGLFAVLQDSLANITPDRRLQLLLVAFCLGAFFEGAAGFGTPVAVTASILIGLGFPPLTASVTALIANTAPVPFAALGTPLVALQGVTGLDLLELTKMTARQLTPFAILIPFWIVAVLAGWRKMLAIWPALVIAGGTYAAIQLAVATLHGPWLVNIFASLITLAILVLFLKIWKPKQIWRFNLEAEQGLQSQDPTKTPRKIFKAWLPWGILSLFVLVWGLPQVKTWLDSFSLIRFPIPGLHEQIYRMPPIVPAPQLLPAVFDFNWLSASGTAILFAGFVSGFCLGYSMKDMAKIYLNSLKQVGMALVTICVTLAIGFVIRYSGIDGTLGLAFAQTGRLYPFFGTLLGWLGVTLTGSDTSSNVLFGNLQKVTAGQLGISTVLMAAANSAGGVMGKMLNAQSIVVASTATHWEGHEADILRSVFWHSVVLIILVGLVVILMAYIPPFTRLAMP